MLGISIGVQSSSCSVDFVVLALVLLVSEVEALESRDHLRLLLIRDLNPLTRAVVHLGLFILTRLLIYDFRHVTVRPSVLRLHITKHRVLLHHNIGHLGVLVHLFLLLLMVEDIVHPLYSTILSRSVVSRGVRGKLAIVVLEGDAGVL